MLSDYPGVWQPAAASKQGRGGNTQYGRCIGSIARSSLNPNRAQTTSEQQGFTLLEVMVCLTILAVGAALALSLISGCLGNIRKVQLRTRTVEHAEAVMELALLDDTVNKPTSFSGDFEDGTRWSVRIENYTPPVPVQMQQRALPQNMNMPVKLLSYTVEMFSPNSSAPDFQLQTLKVVKAPPEDRQARIP
jgi:prepilin-type N-terminal cleavage/methylation domain-containing protein